MYLFHRAAGSAVLLTLCIAMLSLEDIQAAAKPQKGSNEQVESSAREQREYDKAWERKDELTEERSALSDILGYVSKGYKELGSKLDPSMVSKGKNDMAQALLGGVAAKTIEEFTRARQTFQDALIAPANQCFREVYLRVDKALPQLNESIAGQFRSNFTDLKLVEAGSSYNYLWVNLDLRPSPSGNAAKVFEDVKSLSESDFGAAGRAFQDIDSSAYTEHLDAARDELRKGFKSWLDYLNAEKSNRDTELKQINEQINILEDKLADHQTTLIGYLPLILYTLIGGMLVNLLIVRFRNDALSQLMVRERVGAEMLSITAFLIVLLVLGAGKFIEPETLGTLLGTVGGYLLSRRNRSQGESGIKDGSSRNENSPIGPPAPQWTSSSHTLRLPSLPSPRYRYYVWLRDLKANTEELLGLSATGSFAVPIEKVVAGQAYRAWFVSIDESGSTAQGKTVDFTG